MVSEGPNGQFRCRGIELLPRFAEVVASPNSLIRAYGESARASGIGKDRENMWRFANFVR
jgi:hypothetical protein